MFVTESLTFFTVDDEDDDIEFVTSPSQRDRDAKPAAQAPSSELEVILDMQKPEIVLIEDQMNQNTRALVLDVS